MFQKDVTTKDGIVKTVIAQSQEELDEAVKIHKQDEAPYQPDINDPKDGNMVVSPENTHAQAVEEVSTHKDVSTDPVESSTAEEPQVEDKPENFQQENKKPTEVPTE